MAKRISTSFLFFIIEFTSFPIYRAGFRYLVIFHHLKQAFSYISFLFLYIFYKILRTYFGLFKGKNRYFLCCFSYLYKTIQHYRNIFYVIESSNLHHYIHFREELQANIFRQSESIGAGVLRQKLQSKRYDFAVSIVYNSFRFNINFQVNQLNK